MDAAALETAARTWIEALRAGGGDAPFEVAVVAQALPHPILGGVQRRSVLAIDGPTPCLRVSAPAFADLDDRAGGAALDAELRHATERLATAPPATDDDGLLESHARFRRGEDLPAGWYRAAPEAAPAVHVVDLDLFVELEVAVDQWVDLLGRPLTLTILDEAIEIELPEDADGEDALVLPEAGLYDDEEDPEEDDPLPSCGDLHLLPVLYA